eukprot:7145820-Alexandrium_andersonii.AAC.1
MRSGTALPSAPSRARGRACRALSPRLSRLRSPPPVRATTGTSLWPSWSSPQAPSRAPSTARR